MILAVPSDPARCLLTPRGAFPWMVSKRFRHLAGERRHRRDVEVDATLKSARIG